MKAKILIVDDNTDLLAGISQLLKYEYDVTTAASVPSAQDLLNANSYDVVITDLDFTGQALDGLDLIVWIQSNKIQTPIIILSGDTNLKRAMAAQRKTLDDFMIKPYVSSELISAIEKARQRARSLTIKTQGRNIRNVVTKDPRVIEILGKVKRVMESESNLCVCIYGESGTGKEEIAKYAASVKGGPYIAVNMAALSEHLVESELFGSVKGSFSGSTGDKEGKFQAANGGVLFLDEIGDCPLQVQVKLFRAIQEREVVKVGSNKSEKINVKLVVATNKDLHKLVSGGKFREELLYRIEGIPLTLPPLRDRVCDIAPLTQKFILDLSPKWKPASISPQALATLENYSWPNNVRQLYTCIEKSLLESNMREIDSYHLPQEVFMKTVERVDVVQETSHSDQTLDEVLKTAETVAFQKALQKANGSRKLAVEILGITESRFFRRAKELNIFSKKAFAK